MMFHASPHVLDFDPHSGDYGLGFFGNALESGAYYVDDEGGLGTLCYLCDIVPLKDSTYRLATAGQGMRIVPRDAYAITAFLEPLGLYLSCECGKLATIELPAASASHAAARRLAPGTTSSFRVTFEADAPCPYLRLVLTKTASARPGAGFQVDGATLTRGAFQISPATTGKPTTVTVSYTV
jgi:hypothetical protein